MAYPYAIWEEGAYLRGPLQLNDTSQES